jgi:hypothetical protein
LIESEVHTEVEGAVWLLFVGQLLANDKLVGKYYSLYSQRMAAYSSVVNLLQ